MVVTLLDIPIHVISSKSFMLSQLETLKINVTIYLYDILE